MSARTPKNRFRKPYKFKTPFMEINKDLYAWAEKLFYEGFIKAPILHTLKALISARHMKWPTIKQLNQIRTRSCVEKFAQSNAVTDQTIKAHLKTLAQLRIISKKNFYWGWNLRSCIEFIHEGYKSVISSGMKTISSISSSLFQKKRERATSSFSKKSDAKSLVPKPPSFALAPDGAALAAVTAQIPETTDDYRALMRQRMKEALSTKK